MTIKILKLALENFRKVRNATFTLDGQDATIWGANAAGKSTVVDGWLWLLTGKTADGRADSEIKTLGEDGEAKHNLDHSVEAVLDVDGVSLTLRRCLRERWTRKRGSVTAEFTGHETAYEVDGVPANEKQFAEKIATLVPANLLPVLSNPSYFPSRMKWQERRQLLLQVCGDLTTDQVFDASPELAPLRKALNGKSVDDFRLVQVAAAKKVNGELLTLPARIDEAHRAAASDEDADELRVALSSAQDALREAQQAEAGAESGGGVAALRIKLQQAEAAVAGYEAGLAEKVAQATAGARAEKSKAEQAVADAEVAVRRYEREVASLRDGLERAERQIQAKRQEWESESAKELPANGDKTCPTCGQKLSQKATKAANDKAQEDFNARKAETLAQVLADADVLKRGKARIASDLVAAELALDRVKSKLADAATSTALAVQKLDGIVVPTGNGERAKLQRAVVDLREQLADADHINAEAVREAQQATKNAQEFLADVMARKAVVEAVMQAKARVAELEAKQLELAQEYERLQGLVYLCEKFTTVKCEALTDRINARFKHARFQLFATQINGGVAEMCEVTFLGVPYPDLNAASKINVALDIVNTIGQHFCASLPLFVDGAESYQKLIPVSAQTVKLVVAADKTLRVALEPAQQLALA